MELSNDGVNYVIGRAQGWTAIKHNGCLQIGNAWSGILPNFAIRRELPLYASQWGAAGPLFDVMIATELIEPRLAATIVPKYRCFVEALEGVNFSGYANTAPEAIARAYIEAAQRGWLGEDAKATAVAAVAEWEAING